MSQPKWVSDYFARWEETPSNYPNYIEVIKRLQKCSLEMKTVYEKLEQEWSNYPTSLNDFLGAMLDGAIFCNERAARNSRGDNKRLEEVQSKIVVATKELINLLDKHSQLKEDSHVTSNARTEPLYLLEKSGRDTGSGSRRYLFKKHISPLLQKVDGGLRSNKYMPRLNDILNTLTLEMTHPVLAADDMDIVLSSQKTSPADFIRFYLNRTVARHYNPKLPTPKYPLTNALLIVIVQCALGLKEEPFGEDRVRQLRNEVTEDYR